MCKQTPRSPAESREILEQMVAAAPTTIVLLVEDEDGRAIGQSYYNFGSGYACGGVYLWLNCIYIRAGHQQRNYGSRLLDFILEDGLSRDMKLLLCSRHLDNEASRRLFARAGFSQDEQVSMSKVFD